MAINKQCARYCIAVIRAVMWGTSVPEIPETVSLTELYNFAKIHGVEAMVFHALEQLDMDGTDPVWQDWQNRADMLLTQSMVQLAERDTLFVALPAAGIRLLPVKGCWLKEQYPDIDYRQMSDIDILIYPEDARKAETVMLQLGYSKEEESADNHDSYIKPPYMGVELHLSLLPEDDERFDYYRNVWDKAIAVKDLPGMSRLKPEDEYIFFTVHLYKHVMYAGTGIRSFLDCIVYRKLWPDMDKTYLRTELEKLKLTEFAQQVETLSDCWFDTGSAVPESLQEMEDSIMNSAVYGTANEEFQRSMERMYKKYRSRFVAHLVYWLYRLFAPLEEMEPQYPVLKKYPWLLPVFWVVHLVQKVTREPMDLLRHFQKVNKAGEKYGEHSTGRNPNSTE